MNSKTKRRITLTALSGFCLSALVCGAAPFAHAAINAKAEDDDEGVVYSQDFESLSGSGTPTEFGGGTTTLSESEGLYLDIPFQFTKQYGNVTMYSNYAPVLANGVEYTVTTRFRAFGGFSELYFGGYRDNGNCSQFQISPSQTTITGVSNLGSSPFTFTVNNTITQTADGWWNLTFTATGTGATDTYWRYTMRAANETDANANHNVGVQIAELKIEQGTNAVFSLADRISLGLDGNFLWTSFGWDDGKSSANDSVKVAGINGKSLKAVYDFESDGTAKEASKVSLNVPDKLFADTKYTMEFDVAALGNVDEIGFAFKQEKDSAALNTGTVKLKPAASDFDDPTGNIFDAEDCKITYSSATGIYHVKTTVLGLGGTLNVVADMKATNRVGETGLYLDNVLVSENNSVKPVIGVKRTTWNSADGEDFSLAVNFESATSVKLGDVTLTADEYTIADGFLTIKTSVLEKVEDGDNTLTITVGSRTLTATVRVMQAPMAEVYTTDFETMIDLVENLDKYTGNNTPFFQNSSFNPGDTDVSISTADFEDGHGRAVRFRPVKKTDCMLFQTNPGSITGMEVNKWNTVSMDLKPENGATTITVSPIAFNGGVGSYWDNSLSITINVVENSSANNNANIGWSVTPLEDGWYRLSVTFFIAETRSPNKVYVRFFAASEKGELLTEESSSWCVDNFTAGKEMIPSYVRGNGIYDLGADTQTYYLLDLCGEVYDIVSVKLGDKTLVKDTDYILPEVPGAYVRLELTDSFREQYNLNYSGTIMVETTRKNTTLELPFSVANTKPIVPTDAVAYDIAADLTTRNGVAVSADLKGYNFAYIEYDGEELLGSEFNYDAAAKKINFKQSYLKSLAVGNHEYTLYSATGSSAKFTIAVSDTRPAFGSNLTYDKRTGGDLTLDLNLFGKDIVSIVLNGTTLTSEQYTVADNKLTVKEAVVSAFIAGEYDLTVTTIVAVTVTITVVDVPPVISGTNVTATQGEDLVLDVALSNKAIVSITVGGLPLTSADYTCADGKLTIKGDVFNELALGEKKIVLVTEGGSAELTFTLTDTVSEPQEDSGCNSSLSGSLIGLTALGALAAVALTKKKKD